MGAYTPPAAVSREMLDGFNSDIITPVVRGMAEHGIVYRGVLYAGLMLTADGPKVLEFNCRFGDPETQVILPMLNADLVEICEATARGDLASVRAPEWHPGACVGVVLASGGYPGAYTSGHPIQGLGDIPEGGIVFHAGTTHRGEEVVSAGGRVLTAIGRGDDMASARDLAYATAAAISFQDVYYRTDIASREIGTL
jgi:phosphoribosylamine--glycine ligase